MYSTTTTTVNLGNQTSTPTGYQGEPLHDLAERRLRELVEAGNIEAIKLALERAPIGVEVYC